MMTWIRLLLLACVAALLSGCVKFDISGHSKDADDFAAYLKRYPDGTFANIARNRLRKAK